MKHCSIQTNFQQFTICSQIDLDCLFSFPLFILVFPLETALLYLFRHQFCQPHLISWFLLKIKLRNSERRYSARGSNLPLYFIWNRNWPLKQFLQLVSFQNLNFFCFWKALFLGILIILEINFNNVRSVASPASFDVTFDVIWGNFASKTFYFQKTNICLKNSKLALWSYFLIVLKNLTSYFFGVLIYIHTLTVSLRMAISRERWSFSTWRASRWAFTFTRY